MKTLLFALILGVSAQAHAKETIVCAMKDAKNPRNFSSVTVDLTKPLEEYYIDDKGVDIGDENYSFNLQVSRKRNTVEIGAVFQENKHVQDEVGSQSWTVNLSKAVEGKPIVEEPFEDDGVKKIDFVCYYNK